MGKIGVKRKVSAIDLLRIDLKISLKQFHKNLARAGRNYLEENYEELKDKRKLCSNDDYCYDEEK